MEEVDRAVFQYRAIGRLTLDEQQTLDRLQEVVPKYRSAIFVVHRMQGQSAPISAIDAAVRGADRPISAAFEQLESEASAQSLMSRWSLLGQGAGVLLCAALAVFFLYVGYAAIGRAEAADGSEAQSLKEISMRMMRWQEAKDAKAFSTLHDSVCQSLSAVMYLLKSCESFAADRPPAAFRDFLEPIIPSLQAAICETRTIALDFCPLKLQGSGLRGSIDAVWDDCQAQHPEIRIASRTLLDDADVPESLKPIIWRIARMTADWAIQESTRRCLSCELVAWELKQASDQIRLTIHILFGVSRDGSEASGFSNQERSLDLPHAILARAILSGGSSDGIREIPGGLALAAIWPQGD